VAAGAPPVHVETQTMLDPPVGGVLVVFNTHNFSMRVASADREAQILEAMELWYVRGAPKKTTYRDVVEGRAEPTLHRVELGRDAFDHTFRVYAADPERARAVLDHAPVADAFVAAASRFGHTWFDGLEVTLRLGLDAPGTWTEMIGSQRGLTGRLAAALAARMRELAK
jgi:hypothetical protein